MMDKFKPSIYNDIIVAALLHDIGKVWQRTRYKKSRYCHPHNLDLSPKTIGLNGAHAKWSAEFLERFQVDVVAGGESVRDAILFHHCPENAPSDEARQMALCVQISDWLSSSERLGRAEGETASAVDEPLLSIFSSITGIKEGVNWSAENFHYYSLKNLAFKFASDGSSVLVPSAIKKKAISGYNLTPDYDFLWEAFTNELQHLSQGGELTIEFLLQLLEKFCWSVPQAAYVHVPDISLYDHLKTTCAIAACLWQSVPSYDALLNLRQAILNREEISEPLFLLVKGDLSGIHNFIFTIISKFALKTLKGRSLFLEFLTEAIAKTLLRELNLPVANILYCGGGNFYLLVPAKAEKQLTELRKRLSLILLDSLGESLYFALEWVTMSASDFYTERISEKWSEVSEQVNAKKLQQYKEIGLEENYERFFEPFGEGGSQNQCAVCSVELKGETKGISWEEDWEEDKVVCPLCNSFSEMVKKLRNAKKIYHSKSELIKESTEQPTGIKSYDEILSALGTRISFKAPRSKKETATYQLPEKGLIQIPYKIIPKGIPYDSSKKKIRDLSVLAELSTGAQKLAILKMDIDSLGAIFKHGLGDKSTISRISTLSSMISRFFGGYLNEIIDSNPDFRDKCYTIFAGGDDTLIIGTWNIIFDLAYKIYEEFRQFSCGNPHITLSAAIIIISPKYPIVRAAVEAEEALAKAKNYKKTKNSINLFGESFEWGPFTKMPPKEIIAFFQKKSNYKNKPLSEYALIWYLKELLVDMLEKGCSKSLLHKIAKSVRGLRTLTRDASRGHIEVPKVWRLRYYLRDYFKDKSQFKAHADCLITIYNIIIEGYFFRQQKEEAFNLESILVAVRWAELLTRKSQQEN